MPTVTFDANLLSPPSEVAPNELSVAVTLDSLEYHPQYHLCISALHASLAKKIDFSRPLSASLLVTFALFSQQLDQDTLSNTTKSPFLFLQCYPVVNMKSIHLSSLVPQNKLLGVSKAPWRSENNL